VDRHTDRLADRQTGGQTDRLVDRQTGGQTDRRTERQVYRQADRKTDRQTGWQVDRQTNRRTGRQTDRQTDKQEGRQTDGKTNKQKLYEQHFIKIQSTIGYSSTFSSSYPDCPLCKRKFDDCPIVYETTIESNPFETEIMEVTEGTEQTEGPSMPKPEYVNMYLRTK
jgi:hypothetical protein